MKRQGYSLPILTLALLVLGACARPNTTMRTEYQARANEVLGEFARGVSGTFSKFSPKSKTRNAYSTASVSSQLTFGSWQPYSQPYGGYLVSNDQNQNASRCIELIAYIPEQAQYFDFMVDTLDRCLMQMSIYRNPMMTYSLSNLDSSGTDMAGYLNSYALAGQYQAGSYGMYQNYFNQGYTAQPIYWTEPAGTGATW